MTAIKSDITLINTSNKNERLNYGFDNENNFFKLLKTIDNEFKQTKQFNLLDFNLIKKNYNIFGELKTRKCKLNTFSSSIIGLNKLLYYDNIVSDIKKVLYIFFGFLSDDNKNIVYYYIKFNREIFKTFNNITVFNKIHIEIPVNLLIPFENFNTEINPLLVDYCNNDLQ